MKIRWSMVCMAFMLGFFACNWPALAWGPYAQQVIAFESMEPYNDSNFTRDPGGDPMVAPDVRQFIRQMAMPKAWEYAVGTDYAKTSEAFATIMTKVARGRGDDVQAQPLRASQIAEIIGDNMFFGSQSRTAHERWFNELLVDAVLHSGNFDTYFSLDRVRVSSRPELTEQASITFIKRAEGDLISESAVPGQRAA